MATLRSHFHFPHCCSCSPSPKLLLTRNPNFTSLSENLLFSGKIRVLSLSSNTRVCDGIYSFRCFSKPSSEIETVLAQEEVETPPFDINLAVILAGFAFEAYSSPPENIGKREVDAANCQTVILSESFLREIYDGQLFVKLKKGYNFPAMDPWGTSDPYVVMELDSQIVKSKVKWGTKEPTWNEELILNIKLPPTKDLQIAAWDANLVAPHKRMGNAGVSMESLCDGNLHDVLIDLEGMGGGGKIQLEVKYKSFERIEEEKSWWRVPIVTEFLKQNGLDSALKLVSGSETVQARQFVQYAFGQLKSLNDAYFPGGRASDSNKNDTEGFKKSRYDISEADIQQPDRGPERSINETNIREDKDVLDIQSDNDKLDIEKSSAIVTQDGEAVQSDKDFWHRFTDIVNHNVVQRLGLPAPEKIKWDAFDVLNSIGLQSQSIAEATYVESGLATPNNDDVMTTTSASSNNQSSLPDIKKVTQDLLRQTDSILGALMVLNATVTDLTKDGRLLGTSDNKEDASKELENVSPGQFEGEKSVDGSVEDKKAEEMRALFSTAESAMEAWAMLATSMGHPSFIKSEFEKICFLDNPTTDTQVAIWRDSARQRLVVAFRGTEQTKWKDLVTDLMLAPAGLNPERIGGDFKQEVQVHTGFLSAYDSVRIRIISIIKAAIGYLDEGGDQLLKWHVYVTGHSLGGALATLLALELSSSQLAKRGAISVTMYNFGSPRVGNRKFADVYNEKVKDSWRVVNHRDIIPTVPRLMGYCHVAQPVYLAAGDLKNTLKNVELVKDGYQGDVIGEATPDVLVSEFMKGEKELIEKILNTEINIFRSIRDGTALMQHMEDFYYVSLLENVRSSYQTVERPGEDGTLSGNRIQES